MLTLASGGNVGIGTTSPTAKLHVNQGNVQIARSGITAKANGYVIDLSGAQQSVGISVATSSPTNFLDLYSGGDPVNLGGWEGAIRFFTGGPNQFGVERMHLNSSGNLGIGITPSAWGSSFRANQIAPVAAIVGDNNNGSACLGSNWYQAGAGGGTATYIGSGIGALRYILNPTSRAYTWEIAPSGTAGNAITFTQAMTLDASGNLGLNTTTFGTSAAGVLSLGTGTAPTTGPADTVQLFSVDRSAGNTIPAVRCEGSGVTNAGITNTTVTNKIAIQVNGTIYYLLATTNAT